MKPKYKITLFEHKGFLYHHAQVRKWWGWATIYCGMSLKDAEKIIKHHAQGGRLYNHNGNRVRSWLL